MIVQIHANTFFTGYNVCYAMMDNVLLKYCIESKSKNDRQIKRLRQICINSSCNVAMVFLRYIPIARVIGDLPLAQNNFF